MIPQGVGEEEEQRVEQEQVEEEQGRVVKQLLQGLQGDVTIY